MVCRARCRELKEGRPGFGGHGTLASVLAEPFLLHRCFVPVDPPSFPMRCRESDAVRWSTGRRSVDVGHGLLYH